MLGLHAGMEAADKTSLSDNRSINQWFTLQYCWTYSSDFMYKSRSVYIECWFWRRWQLILVIFWWCF